jgi:Zn-dependent protease with chaperone function
MAYLARLHHPSGPLHGVETQVDLRHDALWFMVDGQWQSVPYEFVQLKAGGWDGAQCELIWERSGQWLISSSLQEARRTWLATPPAGLAAQVQGLVKNQSRKAKQRGCGWAALLSFLVAPVALLAIFWFARAPIGSWLVHWVPVQKEMEFGDAIFKSMKPSLREVDEGAAVKVVQELGAKLTHGTKYKYQWHVVEDSEVNAFAFPGGHVVVNTGLIKKAASAEELAGVLAHEVQHVEMRHSLRGVAGELLWQILIGLVWDSGSTLGGVAGNLGSLSFSRNDETEADTHGLQAMANAGIQPQGMVDMMKKLAEMQGLEIALLQTHPASAERVQRLQSLVDALPKKSYTPLTYPWDEVKKSF